MNVLSVPFPPAQRRAYDNVLSETAQRGMHLFHIDGDLDPFLEAALAHKLGGGGDTNTDPEAA